MGKAVEISRSIREGKWLAIEYDSHAEQRVTYFWAMIEDVFPHAPMKLKVKMFNANKSMDILDNVTLYYDSILDARVIEGTTCALQEHLIHKIINHYKDYAFLEFSGVNERVLAYYLECSRQDKEASIKRYHLVSGIDDDVLCGGAYELDDKNLKDILQSLKIQIQQEKSEGSQQMIRLAVNLLAVQSNRGLFPIVYRDFLFDVEHRTLNASAALGFNFKLNDADDQPCFNLAQVYDGDMASFMNRYHQKDPELIAELQANLKRGEKISEMPYVFRFEKQFTVNLKEEYEKISQAYRENLLTLPMKMFFGMGVRKISGKAKGIMVGDERVNMDQYRTIYNAMNQTITYVQGPPGTGKTTTIVNVILSAVLNDQSVLCVSNNNEAINNIITKLQAFTYQGNQILFPLLRLGSNLYISKTLQLLHDQLSVLVSESKLYQRKAFRAARQQVLNLFAPVKQELKQYEESIEVHEQQESLREILEKLAESSSDEVSRAMMISGIEAQLAKLKAPEIEKELRLSAYDAELVNAYLYHYSLKCIHELFKAENEPLLAVIKNHDAHERMLAFRKLLADKEGMRLLTNCFPVIFSTNMSSIKLGSPGKRFDLMIMDEASQCSNPYSLAPMARCQRALFVGDQNQLQPVIVMDELRNSILMSALDIPAPYDYKKNSILSTMLKVDPLSTFILLHDHYRSHEKIIGFSNRKYYGSELNLCAHVTSKEPLKLIDIDSLEKNEKNTSLAEVQAVIEEIKKTPNEEAAVITPFRKQAELLERHLLDAGLEHVKVGTIHTFQGDEKTKVLISSAITKNTQPSTFNWLKNNQELINVAVTRAKKNLVLLGDLNQIRSLSKGETNDFIDLIDYMMKDGEVEVSACENELFLSKVKNFKYYDLEAENELLATLTHLKTVYGEVQIRSQVKIDEVLMLNEKERNAFAQTEGAVFDFVIYDLLKQPLLAIEVTGLETLSLEKAAQREISKQEICERHHLQLLSIHNDYVRRYQYIKKVLLNTLKR